jgi:predicted RNA-binding Zn ribbon-like protein
MFAPDTEWALRAAVELVNTDDDPDTLSTVAELDDWYRRHRFTGRRDRTLAELTAMRDLRGELRTLLTDGRDAAAGRVNAILAGARAVPQLVRHGDLDWHVHAVAGDIPLPQRVAVETAMAMIDLIRADELSRLSVCADADCDGLVLDLSRNRSRRYCSTRCANRNAVAAFRARRRGAA